MDINVVGLFYTFLAFPPLLERGNARQGSSGYMQSQFITTTSFGGLSRAENVSHTYATSKAALLHLSKMLATSFAGYGIRVNSIATGLYITEMTEVSQFDLEDLPSGGEANNRCLIGYRPRQGSESSGLYVRGGHTRDLDGECRGMSRLTMC